MDANTEVPEPKNEQVLGYEPGSKQRESLQNTLGKMTEADPIDLPQNIGGEWVEASGSPVEIVQPHSHSDVLGVCREATHRDTQSAISASMAAAPAWRDMSFDDRAAIFLKAADLLSGPYRDTLNAATMLGQSTRKFSPWT